MKLNENAFANASGVLGAIFFAGCYVFAYIFPGLYKAILDSWMHMLNLDGLWRNAPTGFLLGLISFTIVAWVSGWAFAKVYNSFAKK